MVEGYGVPPAQGTVRLATSRDVPAVAALHSAAISGGFLASLGDRFLSRLYSRIIESSHGFLLVADGLRPAARVGDKGTDTSDLAGFVAGSAEVGRLYREFVRRDGLPVALSSGFKLMTSLPRVVENLRYGTRKEPLREGSAPAAGPAGPETELLALAVDGAARRRGIGAALVESFLDSAATSGSGSARVVVGSENDGALALYRRAGFVQSARLELHSGTESLLLRVRLPRAVPWT
jgi:ribosomal protein S18 acetylase RimI-like enzyme